MLTARASVHPTAKYGPESQRQGSHPRIKPKIHCEKHTQAHTCGLLSEHKRTLFAAVRLLHFLAVVSTVSERGLLRSAACAWSGQVLFPTGIFGGVVLASLAVAVVASYMAARQLQSSAIAQILKK